MKKLVLLIIALGLIIPTIAASSTIHSTNTDYDNYRPIEFEENGILFFVYPDGEFEFEVLYPNHIDIGFRFRNGHVRIGKNLPIRIEQDRYGNIYRIENVSIDYNRFGKVSRIGSVNIYYNHGMIHTIGHLNIVYHLNRPINYIGFVKHKHHPVYDKHYYKPHKKHHKKYSYNDRHYKNDSYKRDNNNRRNDRTDYELERKRRPYSN